MSLAIWPVRIILNRRKEEDCGRFRIRCGCGWNYESECVKCSAMRSWLPESAVEAQRWRPRAALSPWTPSGRSWRRSEERRIVSAGFSAATEWNWRPWIGSALRPHGKPCQPQRHLATVEWLIRIIRTSGWTQSAVQSVGTGSGTRHAGRQVERSAASARASASALPARNGRADRQQQQSTSGQDVGRSGRSGAATGGQPDDRALVEFIDPSGRKRLGGDHADPAATGRRANAQRVHRHSAQGRNQRVRMPARSAPPLGRIFAGRFHSAARGDASAHPHQRLAARPFGPGQSPGRPPSVAQVVVVQVAVGDAHVAVAEADAFGAAVAAHHQTADDVHQRGQEAAQRRRGPGGTFRRSLFHGGRIQRLFRPRFHHLPAVQPVQVRGVSHAPSAAFQVAVSGQVSLFGRGLHRLRVVSVLRQGPLLPLRRVAGRGRRRNVRRPAVFVRPPPPTGSLGLSGLHQLSPSLSGLLLAAQRSPQSGRDVLPEVHATRMQVRPSARLTRPTHGRAQCQTRHRQSTSAQQATLGYWLSQQSPSPCH